MRRGTIDGRLASACLGFASLWICLQSSGFYPLSLVPSVGMLSAANVAAHHLVYIVALLVIASLACAADKAGKLDAGSVPWRSVAVATAGCGMVGHAVLLFADPSVASSQPLMLIGSLLAALFVVASVVAWGCAVPKVGASRPFLFVAASYALAQAIQTVYFGIGAPNGPLLVVASAASAAGLWVSMAGRSKERGATGESLSASRETGGADLRTGIPWSVVVPALIMVYFCDVFVRLLVTEFNGDASVFRKFVTAAAGLVVAILLLVVVKRVSRPEAMLVASISLLAVGSMVAMSLMLLAPSEIQSIARRFLVAGEHGTEAFVWIALLYGVVCRGARPITLYALFAAFVVGLPWALSFDAFYLAGLDRLVDGNNLVIPALTVALVVVAVGMIGILLGSFMRSMGAGSPERGFEDGSLRAQSGPSPLVRADDLGEGGVSAEAARSPVEVAVDAGRAAVESALADSGVTPRELDVAVLVYRGYSAKRIADELCLSEQTVKSYASRVYRKLGIHSKQELIDLVDRGGDPHP